MYEIYYLFLSAYLSRNSKLTLFKCKNCFYTRFIVVAHFLSFLELGKIYATYEII
jgi:hypothetical protein